MAGLRIPVSLNDPSITDHGNTTISPKNGKTKNERGKRDIESGVQELLDCN
jgi:hypothetical protein